MADEPWLYGCAYCHQFIRDPETMVNLPIMCRGAAIGARHFCSDKHADLYEKDGPLRDEPEMTADADSAGCDHDVRACSNAHPKEFCGSMHCHDCKYFPYTSTLEQAKSAADTSSDGCEGSDT